MNDRLANVQPRKVWPVYINRYEPALTTVHATKAGAETHCEHLRAEWCDDDDCYHDVGAFVGTPMEILP